jgi:hypothetical protein
MGRKFSEAPYTPGSLHGYQKKEFAKGAVCKPLKRKSMK